MILEQIKGYEHYCISEKGEVFSKFKGDYLNTSPNAQVEYLQVSLWKNNVGKTHYVHRLVAEAFIPNPLNLPEVNHKDGNKHNNSVDNLEWVDSSGNSYHAVRTGLRTYTNRLTKDEFIACLHSVIGGESYQSLSERVPYRVPFLSIKLRAIAKELGLEEDLNISLKNQRAARNRKVLEVINVNKVQRLSKAA